MRYNLETPLTREKLGHLRMGDTVLLSGTIYTARDASHARLFALMEEGRELPLDLTDAVIYYAGPTPTKPGEVIGSCGPTTSGRMDAYTPAFLHRGLTAMIGKGMRSKAVCETVRETGAVYFAAIGGAGALTAACVTACEVVCYEDLGSEAIRRLTIHEMPLTVILDTVGGNLYEIGPANYLTNS